MGRAPWRRGSHDAATPRGGWANGGGGAVVRYDGSCVSYQRWGTLVVESDVCAREGKTYDLMRRCGLARVYLQDRTIRWCAAREVAPADEWRGRKGCVRAAGDDIIVAVVVSVSRRSQPTTKKKSCIKRSRRRRQ